MEEERSKVRIRIDNPGISSQVHQQSSAKSLAFYKDCRCYPPFSQTYCTYGLQSAVLRKGGGMGMGWRKKEHKVSISILAAAAKYTNNPVNNPFPSIKASLPFPPLTNILYIWSTVSSA
jgi:hypothetical protein